MSKFINQLHKREYLLKFFFYSFSVILMIVAFIYDDINKIVTGLLKIIMTQDILITDYLKIAGLGATLVNVALVTLMSMFIMEFTKTRMSGLSFAALFTILGFSFFGKNIYNIIPIYFGVYLFSVYANEPYRKFYIVAIFSTCLAPLIGTNFIATPFGLLLSATIGIFYGFIIVPLASQVIKFHNGYTLYNVGFAGGIFAIIISSVIRTLGIDLKAVNYISTEYHNLLVVFVIIVCFLFIITGMLDKQKSVEDYYELNINTGRAVTDFFDIYRTGTVFINIGFMGLLSLMMAIIMGVPLNGPIVGAIFTIMGFSAIGVGPRNSFFVVLGCIMMMYLTNVSEIRTEDVLTVLFVMGIAPIAGEYGAFFGIVAGMLHYSVVSFSASWQGALNLYNNGFASGLVAGFLINILDSFRKVRE